MRSTTASWQASWIVFFALLTHRCGLWRCFAFPALLTRAYSLQRLFHPEGRASLDQFYRHHFTSRKGVAPPPPKDTDEVYSLVNNEDNTTVAAVRLSPGRDESYVFLRSLCVSRARRRQGLALQLIQQAIDDYRARHIEMTACFCFAESRLQQLYEQAGFCHTVDSAQTLDWVWKSYEIIAKRMKRKHQDMQLFVKDLTNAELQTSEAIDVILLQHVKEGPRVTSTASLLSDNEYLKRNETFWSLSDRVKVEIWSWSGRMDNQKIERQLEQIHPGTVLVWTGGNTSAYPSTRTTTNPLSFLILDGTWQEARTMFRKLPTLQHLPRFSISSKWSSTYTLRKDFTGWRDRFRKSDENLLCTAEVVAALLDHRGDTMGRDIIRNRLQEFQRDFDKK